MELKKSIKATKKAYVEFLRSGSTEAKNRFLSDLAKRIKNSSSYLLEQNKLDMDAAEAKGVTAAFLDRLLLTKSRIEDVAASCLQIGTLDDPVGRIEEMTTRPQGFRVGKMSTPIGVIAIIYEARPNVTVEAATLCIKSGNAVILKGGSDAHFSNGAFAKLICQSLRAANLSSDLVNFIVSKDRAVIGEIVKMEGYVDCVIPRGGEGLIRAVAASATVPVLKHYKGVCHLYVDKECDLQMAKNIAVNAKVQRPAVCNSLETLLIHKDIAEDFLPAVAEKLKSCGVVLRGCDRSFAILNGTIEKVEKENFFNEYLDLILNVKVVDSIEEAISHINYYGSAHTDAIVTKNIAASNLFVKAVDSSSVIVNATTRLSDGGVYGLGAEIGISTDKLHARGPMGLEELTSKKWIVFGEGHIRN